MFLLLVVLLLRVVAIELSKGLAVWISLSSKKEFVTLKLLQSGQFVVCLTLKYTKQLPLYFL